MLIPASQDTDEAQQLTQIYMTRAVLQIGAYPREDLYNIQENISAVVSVKCCKKLHFRGHSYYLANTLVRLQTHLQLIPQAKKEFIHLVSRRLFYASEGLKQSVGDWLVEKNFTDFHFLSTGYILANKTNLKMVLTTLRYTISHSFVPVREPMSSPLLFLRHCKWASMARIYITTSTHPSIINNPVFTRDMLAKICPPEYRRIVMRGVCYMPASRERSLDNMECWAFHTHSPYSSDSEKCPDDCVACLRKSPLSLFCIAQLTCIRTLFIQYRGRLTSHTHQN